MAKRKIVRKDTTWERFLRRSRSEKIMIVLSILIALSMIMALFVAFAPQAATTGGLIHLPLLLKALGI
jgi:hypothetical protein